MRTNDDNENAAFDIKSSLPKNGLVTQHHSYEFLLSYYNFKNIQQHCSSSHLFYISFSPFSSTSSCCFRAFHEIVFRAFSRCEFIQRFTDNLSVCQEIHLSTVSLKREGANTSIYFLLYVSFFLTHGVQFGIQYTDYLSIITKV